jgi:hypothetical protein
VVNLKIPTEIPALTLNDSRLKIIDDATITYSNFDQPLTYYSFRGKEEILNRSEVRASNHENH